MDNRPASKFDLNELQTYWQQVHRDLTGQQSASCLIVENNPALVNRFDDFAHRLGMRASFRRLGELAGSRVLDIGCGRGRWSAAFAARGARVTGVDWSSEALEHARRRVPSAEFRAMPITSLDFPAASFDVVNSVTVIQHLPYEEHEKVLGEAGRVLAPGGLLSLLELIAPQPGQHVFPRQPRDWIALAESAGFVPLQARGCCYELVYRPYKYVVERLKSAELVGSANGVAPAAQSVSLRQRANRLVMAALALPSFPVEWISRALPMQAATHAAMVFRKAESKTQ